MRFYGNWNLDESALSQPDLIAALSREAVPMGSVLQEQPTPTEHGNTLPTFFVWAVADPLDAPLQRLQMVKGWVDDNGETHEQVTDIACSDGLRVDTRTGRCPDNGASVDLNTCRFSEGSGARELKQYGETPTSSPINRLFITCGR